MVESRVKVFQFEIENGVTDVGLRLAVSQYLPDELELRIDNLGKNTVRIYLRGGETDARKFYDLLKTQSLGDSKNPRFTSLQEVSSEVPVNSDRFFHKLQSEQLGKFVSTGIQMGRDINRMGSVVGGLDNKYHTISLTLKAQLIISFLLLLVAVYAVFFAIK